MKKALFLVLGLALGDAYAGVSVTPAAISTGSLGWWQGASSVSNAGNAQVTRGVTASLLSSLGAANSLPSSVTATIPRAALASSAANILKRAGGVGLAAYGLYSLLSPMIGLNSDGTVLAPSGVTQTDTGAVWWEVNSGCNNKTMAACIAYIKGSIGAGSVRTIYYGPNAYLFQYMLGSNWSNYGLIHFYGTSCATGTLNPANGYCEVTQTTPQPVTESELATKIQSSPATEKQLFDSSLADAVAKSYSNDMVAVVPVTTPASISASPVTTPQEVISTSTVPNPDGTTSTVQRKAQTTATPQVSGSTAQNIALDWSTTTTETVTNTNNSTNVTTTTTTVTNNGNTANQQQADYGTFAGASPDDAFVAGKAKIQASLCGGNCATALSCASGTCTPIERINLLKAKYSLATTSSGTCPAFTMDISGQGYGSHTSTAYCDLAESVRSQVATIISLVIAIGFIMIVLGA